jgi:hypothetical protein
MRTILNAYWMLMRFDLYLAYRDFPGLYKHVRNSPLSPQQPADSTTNSICHAVDLACIWYWKEAHCLQRSAVTVCLLREHGVSAEMVIGTQLKPLKAHAWVEVAGRVVNDKSYVNEIYSVLDRC